MMEHPLIYHCLYGAEPLLTLPGDWELVFFQTLCEAGAWLFRLRRVDLFPGQA